MTTSMCVHWVAAGTQFDQINYASCAGCGTLVHRSAAEVREVPTVNGHAAASGTAAGGAKKTTTAGTTGTTRKPEQVRGQLRFAEMFTEQYGGKLLHVHGLGWHEFDGCRWAPCLDGAPQRAVHTLIKQALDQLSSRDKTARDELLADVRRVESAVGVSGVLDLAKTMRPCTIAAQRLDESAHLLNTASGTVDLRTGLINPCQPVDHLSKVTRARFDPDATDDTFEEFLRTAQPDEEMRAFLARSLGSALLGQVREHVLLIWFGVGANGKGTLRDAVRHALGDYAIEVPTDILLQNKYGQQALAPERMRLRGARLAFCSEIDNGAKLDEAVTKRLTGGDPVNACLKYQNPIQFDPSHTLIMLTNHLPQVRGDDPATWRRLMAVPFDVVVPEADRDPDLPRKLEAASAAVLAWLYRGWLDYQKHGLMPPKAVTAATTKYQLDSDVLARFLADGSAVLADQGSVLSAVLYRAFVDWTRAQGEPTEITNKAFSEALGNRGYTKVPTKRGALWRGLMVINNDAEQDRF